MVKMPDVEKKDAITMASQVTTTTKSVDVSRKVDNLICTQTKLAAGRRVAQTSLHIQVNSQRERPEKKRDLASLAPERTRETRVATIGLCFEPAVSPSSSPLKMVRIPFSQLAGRIKSWNSPTMARLPDHYYKHAMQVQKEGERVHAVPIETKIADYTLADEETLRV